MENNLTQTIYSEKELFCNGHYFSKDWLSLALNQMFSGELGLIFIDIFTTNDVLLIMESS